METSNLSPPKDLSVIEHIEHIKELISLSYSGANEGFSHQLFRRSRGLTVGQSQIQRELDFLKRNYRQQLARRDSESDDSPSAGEENVEEEQWLDEDNFQKVLNDVKRRNEEALELAEERIDHLDDERGELSKSVQDLRAKLEQRDEKQNELAETTERTQAELRQAQSESEKALSALNRTRQDVEKLNGLLAEATAKNKDLQSLAEKSHRLEESVKELQASLSSKTQETKEEGGDPRDLNSGHESRIQGLQDSLQEARTKSQRLDELVVAHEELERRTRDLDVQLNRREQEAKDQHATLNRFRDERDEKHNRVEELIATTNSRDKEIQSLDNRNREMQQESRRLEAFLSQKDQDISEAKAAIQKLQAEYSSKQLSQERDLKEINMSLNRARNDAEEAGKALQAVRKELDDSKAKQAEKDRKIIASHEDLRRTHSEYNKQKDGLEGNLRELERQLSRKEQETRTARDALEGVRTTHIKQSHNLENTLNEARKSLAATEQESKESKTALKAAKGEIEALRESSEATKAAHDKALKDLAISEQSWKKASDDSRQEHVAQITELRHTHENEIHGLQARLQSEQSKTAELEGACRRAKEEHEIAKVRLEHQMAELHEQHEAKLRNLQQQLQDERSKLTETENAFAGTTTVLADVRGQLGGLQRSVELSQDESRSLHDQLEEQHSKYTELESAHRKMVKEHEDAEDQIQTLQAALHTHESEVQQLRDQLDNEKSKFTELEKSYSQAKEEHDSLKAQLEELQKSSDQLRRLHEDQFKQAIEDLTTERSRHAGTEQAHQDKARQLQEAEDRIKNLQRSASESQKDLESRIRAHEGEFKAARSKIAESERTHKQTLEDLTVERLKAADAEKNFRTKSDQCQKAQHELEELENNSYQSRQAMERDIEELKRELDGIRSKLTEATRAHNTALEDLSKERNRAADAEQAHQHISQQLQVTEASHKDLQHTTNQSHQSLERQIQGLENELKESRSKFAEAERNHQHSMAEAEERHNQSLVSVDQELANSMSKLVGFEAALEESKHSADLKHQENMSHLNEQASKFSEAERLHVERVQAMERERDQSIRQTASLQSSHEDAKKAFDDRTTQFEKDLEKEKSRFNDAERAHAWQVAAIKQTRDDAHDRAENFQKMIDDLQQSRRQDAERSNQTAEKERSIATSIEQSLRQQLKNMEQAHTLSLDEAREDTVSLQKQLAETKNNYRSTILETQQKHESDMEEVRVNIRDTQQRLRETETSHRSALKDLEDHMTFKLADVESTKRKELQELQTKHQQQMREAEQSLKDLETRRADERKEAEKVWERDAEEAKKIAKRVIEDLKAEHSGQMRVAEESHRTELVRRNDLHDRLAKEAEEAQKSALADLDNRMRTRITELKTEMSLAAASHNEIQEKHNQRTKETDERHKSAIADLEIRLAKELAESDAARKEILESQAKEHARLMGELRESHQAQLQEQREAHERMTKGKEEAASRDLHAAVEYHRQVLAEAISNEKRSFEAKLTDLQASHRAALLETMAEAQSKSESEISSRAAQHELEIGRSRESHSDELVALQNKFQEALEANQKINDERASLLSEMGSLRRQLDDSRLERENGRATDSSAAKEIKILEQEPEEASTYQRKFTRRMEEEMQRAIASAKSAEDERDVLAAQVNALRMNGESGVSGDKSTEDSLRKKLLYAKKREGHYLKEHDLLKTQIRALQQQLQPAQDERETLRDGLHANAETPGTAQPATNNTPIMSKRDKKIVDLRREDKDLRQNRGNLRTEPEGAKEVAAMQDIPRKFGSPEIPRYAAPHASEDGSRIEKPAKQKTKRSKNRSSPSRSFEEYLHRAEVELSDLGKAISANETLFAQKIREHVGDLQKAKDQLSREYKAKHEAMLQARAELEEKLATKHAEDLAKARAELVAQYTTGTQNPRGDENLANIEELTPRRKQALREADAQLVADHDHTLATKKSQLEIKLEENVQTLEKQFDAEFSRLLKDRANLETDLSISPDHFEQMSKSLELEVERLNIGSRGKERDTVPKANVGTADLIRLTPARVKSPTETKPPSGDGGTSLRVQDRKEKYRMAEAPEISRSFLDSPSPARNRTKEGTRDKVIETQTRSPRVLPIPHRIAAAQASPPAPARTPRS